MQAEWSAFSCFPPGRSENVFLDRPAFSRFLSITKMPGDVVMVLQNGLLACWHEKESVGMSTNHHVRPLAGRTVRLSSMLAMQAEVSHTFHAVALKSLPILASSMFASSRSGRAGHTVV